MPVDHLKAERQAPVITQVRQGVLQTPTLGFELVLTHWFYLYLPWFFPFVALALVAQVPGRPADEKPAVEPQPLEA